MIKNYSPKLGDVLIYFSLGITVILWILSKNSISEILATPILSINQVGALLGTVLFSWSFILATRLDFLEKLFKGADRVYRVHRRVSEVGAVMILAHVGFLILNNPDNILSFLLPIQNEQSVNFGIYAFWIFAVLILLTLFIRKLRIPYHYWKQMHKFVNLAMILAFIHVIAIKSDTAIFLPLGTWMNTVVALGIASGIYKTFFYTRFGPRYEYKVESIDYSKGIHDIRLKAVGKKMPFKSAQYAYVSFRSSGLSKESHPYSIASMAGDDTLRFTVKELGDYTKKLGAVKIGDRAIIWGPHGSLGDRFKQGKEDAVFVAGGVGIAAFIGMYKEASLEKSNRKTTLFYCTKYQGEAVFEKELKAMQGMNQNLRYYNQYSRGPGGARLSASQIKEGVNDPKETVVYLCGPKKMMDSLTDDLIEEGFLRKNMVFEDFEML